MQVTETAEMLAFGEWRLDTTGRHLLDAEGTLVALSGAEYRLLRVFLDNPQRVLTRDQLLNLTQGRQSDPFDRSIDLLVSRCASACATARANRATSRRCATRAMCSRRP